MKNFPSIRKNEDFRLVYRKGRSCSDGLLVMYVMKNGTEKNRIGISVSKKVGNSVVRHRMTRLLRESFRLKAGRLTEGNDIVVVVRPAAAGLGYAQVADSYEGLCGRQGILKTC